MMFEYTVRVQVERMEGKFATKDELSEQIEDALEQAAPPSLEGENGGQYDITEWEVERTDA